MSLSWLNAVSERLREADLFQLLAALFAVLLVVLSLSWPQGGDTINNSWFVLMQTKLVVLLVLMLVYGAAVVKTTPFERAVTLAALGLIHLLTLPVELLTFAASFPEVSLAWPLLLVPLQLIAFFGLGFILGSVLASLRLSFLVSLAAPLVLLGALGLDVWLQLPLFNPLTAYSVVTPLHLGFVSVFSIITLVLIARPPASPS